MIIGQLHGGPRNGEEIEMPWARIKLNLPRWTSLFIEDAVEDEYWLRPPWRGQALAHYDFVEPLDLAG